MTGPVPRPPAVLLMALVLLAAAIGPGTAEAAPGLERAGTAGTGSAASEAPDRLTVPDLGPSEFLPPGGLPDRAGQPALFESIGDRIAVVTERLDAVDWRPPMAVLLFGYTREIDDDTLDHEGRRRVYDLVRSSPGAHIAAIVDAVDVSRSTVRYHLRVLEDADLVTGATVRGRHRYVPAGADPVRAAALFDGPTRTILEAIGRFEPVSITGIAEETGRAPSTVTHHLGGLEDAGLVARERADGRVLVSLEGTALGPNGRQPADPATSDPHVGLSAE